MRAAAVAQSASVSAAKGLAARQLLGCASEDFLTDELVRILDCHSGADGFLCRPCRTRAFKATVCVRTWRV